MANHEKIGEMTFANFIAGNDFPVVTGLRTILANAGTLKAGTALAANSAGKLVILGTEGGTANCILAEDVEVGTADVKALVYLAGHFCGNKLAVKASYTITATDAENFRKGGIYLSDSVN